MNGFWEGGYRSLETGFRDEIARLEQELARAGTQEEKESILAELDAARAKWGEISRGHLLF